MTHLKKSGTTGHLLKTTGGHLVRECVAPRSCPCGTWPPAEWPCGGLVEEYLVTGTIEAHDTVLDCSSPPDETINFSVIVTATVGPPSHASCNWEGADAKISVNLWLDTVNGRWVVAVTNIGGTVYWGSEYAYKTTGLTPVDPAYDLTGCTAWPHIPDGNSANLTALAVTEDAP